MANYLLDDAPPTPLAIGRAIRDSADLGIDRGMRVEVWEDYRDGTIDLYVPSLDMVIASVRRDHPDIVIVWHV